MFDKTVKNQEIQEAFAGQLATGQPVIFSVEQTANPDYVVLGIAQTIKTEGSATEEQKLFLGLTIAYEFRRSSTIAPLLPEEHTQCPVLMPIGHFL